MCNLNINSIDSSYSATTALFNTNGKCSFLLRPRVETLNNISCCVLQAYSFCVISFFLWKRMFRVNYVLFYIFFYSIRGREDKWHAWTENFYFLKCQHNNYQNVLQDMIDFIWLKIYPISQDCEKESSKYKLF